MRPVHWNIEKLAGALNLEAHKNGNDDIMILRTGSGIRQGDMLD